MGPPKCCFSCPKSVSHSYGIQICPWCVRLISVIVIVDVHSVIFSLSSSFSDVLHPQFAITMHSWSVGKECVSGTIFWTHKNEIDLWIFFLCRTMFSVSVPLHAKLFPWISSDSCTVCCLLPLLQVYMFCLLPKVKCDNEKLHTREPYIPNMHYWWCLL